jgi:hypothetical protein
MIQIPQHKFKGLSNVGLQVMNAGNNESSKSLLNLNKAGLQDVRNNSPIVSNSGNIGVES